MAFRGCVRAAAVGALAVGLFALASADGLVAAGKQEEAKKYHDQLKTAKDAKKKIEALEELGKLAMLMKSLVTPAVPDIVATMKDKDATVRGAAAHAYGRTDPDPKDAVPALVKMLKEDKDEAARIGAAQGLGAIGSGAKDAAKDLREVIKTEDKKSKVYRASQDAMRLINQKK